MSAKVWIARIDPENYRSFKPALKFFDRWVEWITKFQEERSFSQEWTPVEMVLFEGEKGEKRKERRKPIPDFTGGYVVYACNERARAVIEPLTRDQVEFLPLITPVGTYFEMNLQRLSCLDIERSQVKRFKDGQIMRVIRYSFRSEMLNDQHIFWIREEGGTVTFVSDELKQLVEAHGLTGLEFYPVPLVEE